MIRSLFTAATGMQAQQTSIDVISNNLANVNTSGFKKSRADFQDLIYQALVEPGAPTTSTTANSTGAQVGLGVKLAGIQKVYAQGDLKSTGNSLDMAIEGDGFIEVTLPDGTSGYTRDGSMRLDEAGQIITADGLPLASAITIPPDSVANIVGTDGTVSVILPGSPTPQQVGQIQLVRFSNPAGLRSVGQNLVQETESSGAPTPGIAGQGGYGRIAQGFLESSNVSVVEEVVNMILSQRAYESGSKAIETSDTMLQAAINLKR